MKEILKCIGIGALFLAAFFAAMGMVWILAVTAPWLLFALSFFGGSFVIGWIYKDIQKWK